ncbi:MAG TPA: glycosyltransferase [Blastocatellia bacterium]|nr:glycosyltransferase [Blastocatellia bacterium]
MPSISAIIPTYNHGRFVAEAIESALGQTRRLDEVIVVDDGSTDDTGSVLSKYADRINVIRQKNSGVAAARNRGAEQASGDLLAFLDSDDRWHPEKIERQAGLFETNPRLGLVHCGVREIDERGAGLREESAGLQGWVYKDLLMFQRPVILGGGSAALIPKDVFDAAGGFDPDLSTSADWDLFYRVSRRYEVGFVPATLVDYRVHSGNMHGNIGAMEHDMLLAFRKAFEDPDPDLQKIRRRCYGNLHTTLAGSYYVSGYYGRFLRHAVKGVALTPRNLGRFAGYPMRMIQRLNSNP